MNPPPPTTGHHHHPPDLSTALSSLKSLLHLSTSTLHSFPIPQTTTPLFLPCPSNPNHHLPPSSLFSHHLTCPSTISLIPPNYPHTLLSTTPPPPLPSPTSHLHYSLQSYLPTNFFYRNCPAPVSPTNRPPPLLILPPILHLECTDVGNLADPVDFDFDFVRFLPSEIWAIRSEVEAWNGVDVRFSIRVMRAIVRMRDCEVSRVLEWIVARSPRYGVIIDFAMRDHLVVLVRLCLKVIVREAIGLLGFMVGGEEVKVGERESSRGFDCPVFRDVMGWLGTQFGVLYGEMNGRSFAVDVLRECILDSAVSASLFPLEEMSSELVKVDNEGCKETRRNVGGSVISLSQVAAAVAALHERSLIEENIRALREARLPSAYQRNMEHSHVAKIANEERQKRSDYRPIIEHDGLSWQRSQNQDANKVKTREELLAEERDYKRRRMSYRGKKSKRSTVEVMRDIIEEYMEDIKKFGEMGSTSKTMEETEGENKHVHDHDKKQLSSYDYKDLDDDFQNYRPDSSLDHDIRDSDRNVRMVKDSRMDYDVRDSNRNVRMDHDVHDARRRSSRSREHHQREIRDFEEASEEGSSRRSHRNGSKSREERYDKREKYGHENDNRKRRDEDYREHSHRDSGRIKRNRDDKERHEKDRRHRDRERRKSNRNSSSRPERHSSNFEDRYDPAGSGEVY